MKRLEKKYLYLFGLIAGFVILLFASSFFLLPVLGITGSFKDLGSINLEELINKYQGFLMMPGYLIAIAFALIFFKDIFIEDAKYFAKNIIKCLIWIVVAVVLIIGIGHLFEVIFKALEIDTSSVNQEAIIKSLTSDGRWAMILSVGIVAPIFEELLFRKCTFGFLKESGCPRWVATLVTIFVFAFIHCTNENFMTLKSWIFLLNYLSLSAVLTLPYVFNKENIYVSTIIHIINNVISILAVYGVINACIF